MSSCWPGAVNAECIYTQPTAAKNSGPVILLVSAKFFVNVGMKRANAIKSRCSLTIVARIATVRMSAR
jgi:hypothetical protein